MKILQESDFAFHPPFSPSRRIVAFLTDSLILIAVILLCFKLVDLLYAKYDPKTQQLSDELARESEAIAECFAEAQLMTFGEQGKAEAFEIQGQKFIYSLVLSTLGEEVSEQKAYLSEGIYNDMGDTARSVFYYFAEFKPAHREQYADYDENKAGAAYAEELFLQACGNEADSCFGDDFPLLERNTATALDRLICFREDSCVIDGNTYYGRETFLTLLDAFSEVLLAARSDLAENYRPYAELQESFASSREEMIGLKTAELCLAYASGILLCFLVLPIVLRGQSAGMHLMGGRCIGREGLKMQWYSYLLRPVFAGFTYFINVVFAVLLMFGTNCVHFLTFRIGGAFPVYALYLISAGVLLLSLILLFADRTGRRTLTDLLSATEVKEK